MSDGWYKVGTLVFTILSAAGIIRLNYHDRDHEERITALEQSQYTLKESAKHADYKLQTCMNQLRSKP